MLYNICMFDPFKFQRPPIIEPSPASPVDRGPLVNFIVKTVAKLLHPDQAGE